MKYNIIYWQENIVWKPYVSYTKLGDKYNMSIRKVYYEWESIYYDVSLSKVVYTHNMRGYCTHLAE